MNKLINSSTYSRAKYGSLLKWLIATDNKIFTPRVTNGMLNGFVELNNIMINDKVKTERTLVNLSSYNYMGLNGNEQVLKSAREALEIYGPSTSGVRLLNGTLKLHQDLEDKLASFIGTEDALTFSSGLTANLAAIATLCSDEDIIFSDELNHQSIIDAIKLSGSKCVKYLHNDMEQLGLLLKNAPIYSRKFIVTDGVFSMDGDICFLPDIINLARMYDAYVIVDDAHAITSIGANGKGTTSYYNLPIKPDLITGSLSKGLPGIGGYIAGSEELIDFFRYSSNPYIFSSSLPAPQVAAILKGIEILEDSPELTIDLHVKEARIRNGLNSIGLNTMASNTPIIPILIGDRLLAYQVSKMLDKEGVYINPVIFPAVSLSKARLRINASINLTFEQIDFSLTKIEAVAKKYELLNKFKNND